MAGGAGGMGSSCCLWAHDAWRGVCGGEIMSDFEHLLKQQVAEILDEAALLEWISQ